jgi:hypothetical protein
MNTRKPKPTPSLQVELPAEELQVQAVVTERKTPTRAHQSWAVETPPLVTRSLPARGKFTLH